MKSGVFPFALHFPAWGVEGVSCIPTQIVAQCMNYYPWTTAVTPCGWNLHALPADQRGVELTKSNSWWHILFVNLVHKNISTGNWYVFLDVSSRDIWAVHYTCKFLFCKKEKSIQDGSDFSRLRAMFLACFIRNPQISWSFFNFRVFRKMPFGRTGKHEKTPQNAIIKIKFI